jgi:hypothetical protein
VDANDQSQRPPVPPPEQRWEDGDPSFPSGLAFPAPGAPYRATAQLFAAKYRLLEQLGRGGMGVVYGAEHIHSGASVAVKIVPAKDPVLGDRMVRESRALARLGHPKIVQMFDSGRTDEGDYYIIMERVPGETLRTLMQRAFKKGRRLSLRLVLGVLAETAEAVASAHGAGIVHRDVKPENIMVMKLGHAKLIDFGLAKDSATVAPADTLGAASNPANVTGTPKYMAPEQVNGGDIDGRTDIYAFGIVLYEAVCGRTPYGDDPNTAPDVIMGHHLFAPPKPIHDFAPHCPDDVCAIILRCLEKNPAQRYESAAELAKALRNAGDRCVERARAAKAMGRVVRVTEPMPEFVEERPVLPFGKPQPLTVVAPVISQMMPPEDEEVTLKRGTILPKPEAEAPPPVSAPAPPAVQTSPAFRPPPARVAAPALVSCGATPARPAASAPAPPSAVASAPPAPSAPAASTAPPPAASAAAPASRDAASIASGSTANDGLTVETAAAGRKWFMKAPPYSLAAVGGVVIAVALSLLVMGSGKKSDAQEPIANMPPAVSALPAPAPPPAAETAAPAPPPAETAAPAPPPAETAAPAPPPAETAAPAPLPPPPSASVPALASRPPPVKPAPVRPVTPAPSGTTPVHREPVQVVFVRKPTPPATPSAATPPASAPPPPPAPEKVPHRIFGSEQ